MIPLPISTWLEENSALELVLLVGAILWLFWMVARFLRRAIPGVERAILFLKSLGRLSEFMDLAESRLEQQATQLELHSETLETIKHEVLPNNGGSMRDDVTTLGLRIEKVEAKLTKDYERFEEITEHLRIREQTRSSAAALGGTPSASCDVDFADSFNPYPVHDQETL